MSAVAAREDAEARRDRIKAGLVTLWDDIKTAWRERDWLALGYESWDTMCDAEYRVGLVLPRSERPEIVADLRAEGMSTRAIAAAVGASKSTVHDDLSGVQNRTPEPVVGIDGKTYQPTHPVEVITAEEFVERYDADNEPTPDLDTLIPTDQRFRLRFAKRLLATHDLLTDMDYPQYFDDEMAERLARFVDNLTRKHTEFSKSRRTLRVVQGGNP